MNAIPTRNSFISEADNLDVNILVTAYSATLDAATLNSSVAACLSDNAKPPFWTMYMSKLKETVVNHAGPWERWPKPVLDVFGKIAGKVIQGTDLTQVSNDVEVNHGDDTAPIQPKKVPSEDLDFLRTVWREYPRCASVPMQLRALVSTRHGVDTTNAHAAWEMLSNGNIPEICDTITLKIGM